VFAVAIGCHGTSGGGSSSDDSPPPHQASGAGHHGQHDDTKGSQLAPTPKAHRSHGQPHSNRFGASSQTWR